MQPFAVPSINPSVAAYLRNSLHHPEMYVHQPVGPMSVHLSSVRPSVCQIVRSFARPSVRPSGVRPSLLVRRYSFDLPFVCPSVRLSVRPVVRLAARPLVRTSVCWSLSVTSPSVRVRHYVRQTSVSPPSVQYLDVRRGYRSPFFRKYRYTIVRVSSDPSDHATVQESLVEAPNRQSRSSRLRPAVSVQPSILSSFRPSFRLSCSGQYWSFDP